MNKKNKTILKSYAWKGLSQQHGRIDGIVTAPSLTTAKIKLERQGVIPKRIVKKRLVYPTIFAQRVFKPCVFIKQLAALMEANIPLAQALTLLATQQKQARYIHLIDQIRCEIETGASFAEVLMHYPQYFDSFLCEMVHVGEHSGTLIILLKQYVQTREKITAAQRKMTQSLLYPACVTVITLIVTLILLVFMVPQFETLYKNFNAELPLFTQYVIKLSHLLQFHSRRLLLIFIGVWVGLRSAKKHLLVFNFVFDKTLLALPFIGDLLQKNLIARFARTLAITFSTGLPIDKAIASISEISNNLFFKKVTQSILRQLVLGQNLHHAMQESKAFPVKAVQMIAIGEETGTLAPMLTHIANDYEEEIDRNIEGLSSILEPITMALLGILVGGLIIAMYLPIFKLGAVI